MRQDKTIRFMGSFPEGRKEVELSSPNGGGGQILLGDSTQDFSRLAGHPSKTD